MCQSYLWMYILLKHCASLIILEGYSLSHDQVKMDIWSRCQHRDKDLVLADHDERAYPNSPTFYHKQTPKH